MSDNTHPAVAKFRQEGVHDWQGEEGSTDATQLATILDAQVEATLALAYEQRTANLLAFERAQWQAWNDNALGPEGRRLWELAANQIPERLDLNREVGK